MFIDTHAHLTFPDYKDELKDVLKRARTAGVSTIVNIGSGRGLEDNKASLKLAKSDGEIYSTIGFHPHDASEILLGSKNAKKADKDPFAIIEKLAKDPKVVAVGEIGLDYHYLAADKKTFAAKKADQIECFVRQLALAKKLKLPIIIHDREAHNDTLFAVKSEKGAEFGGVMHCFSGDVELAKKVLDLGMYISITGAVTFKKKAEVLQDVVRCVPIEKLLIETDCPFIAPEPYRGKINEPAHVVLVAKKIAELKGLSLEDVGRITSLNARRLFHLKGEVPVARIAYSIRDSLYLNITNRCTLACTFCPKRTNDYEVKGYNLKLDHEPDVEDIFKAIGDPAGFKEVVFCGYGEPTTRLELLKTVAGFLKDRGVHVRLNTDGLANLIHARNVVPELKGLVDEISVSINASTPEGYIKLCPSKYKAKAFEEVCSFIKEAARSIPLVTASAVSCPGVDIPAIKQFVEKELKVKFRERKYEDVG